MRAAIEAQPPVKRRRTPCWHRPPRPVEPQGAADVLDPRPHPGGWHPRSRLAHQRQRASAGRIERIGYLFNVAGAPLIAIGNLALLGDRDDAAGGLAVAIWTVGLVLFGIGTARARYLPTERGVAIAVSQPLTALVAVALSPLVPVQSDGSYTGTIVHGLVWLFVAAGARQIEG
jgi:hypothetical protein